MESFIEWPLTEQMRVATEVYRQLCSELTYKMSLTDVPIGLQVCDVFLILYLFYVNNTPPLHSLDVTTQVS